MHQELNLFMGNKESLEGLGKKYHVDNLTDVCSVD